jgi:hypothetical protein
VRLHLVEIQCAVFFYSIRGDIVVRIKDGRELPRGVKIFSKMIEPMSTRSQTPALTPDHFI